MGHEEKSEISAQEIIDRAYSLGELLDAVRRIGSIESLTPEVGTRSAEHWVDAVKKVVWRHAKGDRCLALNSVTRRYRLRFRLMELLGIAYPCGNGDSASDTGMNVF